MLRGIASSKYLSAAQLATIIRAARDRRHPNARRDQLLLGLIGVAGLTPAEALELRRRDVRPGWITAGRRRRRDVPVFGPLARLLDVYVGQLEGGATAPLFRITTRQARRLFRLYARRAGLEGLRLYCLRHTAAARLGRRLGSALELQRHLGYVSKQSAQLYINADLELQRELLELSQ